MLNAYKEEVAHEEEAMAAHARAHTRCGGAHNFHARHA